MSCTDLTDIGNIDLSDPDAATQALQQCMDTLSDPNLWIWLLVITVACAAVGALIGKYKNAIARDALLGAALGPIGWIISLLLPVRKLAARCIACHGVVDSSDAHCRHCGASLRASLTSTSARDNPTKR